MRRSVWIAILALGCRSASDAAPAACDPSLPRCDGTFVVQCKGGTAEAIDCAIYGTSCRVASDGHGYCGDACPEDPARSRVCVGDVLRVCDGALYALYDCSKSGMHCGRDSAGVAQCSPPCLGASPQGLCAKDHLTKCDGDVFVSRHCDEDGLKCLRDETGEAFCGRPCGKGVGPFGACEGSIAHFCSGDIGWDVDCASRGARCETIDRFGVGCRGCGSATPEGTCSGDVLSICGVDEVARTSFCGAGACDAKGCTATCAGAPATCAFAGIDPGAAICVTSKATGFSYVQRCVGGVVRYDECPAATDGSVRCETTDGKGRCVVDCAAGALRRCTDRNVLVSCADGAWTDCGAFGATCTESSGDARCACTKVSEAAAQCRDGSRWTCKDGALAQEPCTCR